MDIRKVKKLIELLEESGIAEIEITEGEESVRISRYGTSHVVTQMAHSAAPAMAAPAAPAAAPSAPAAAVPATSAGRRKASVRRERRHRADGRHFLRFGRARLEGFCRHRH